MNKDYLGRPIYNAGLEETYLAAVQGRAITKWATDQSAYNAGKIAVTAPQEMDAGGRLSGSVYNLADGELVLINTISVVLTTVSDTAKVYMAVCSDYDGQGTVTQISAGYVEATGAALAGGASAGFKIFTPEIAVAHDVWLDDAGNVKYPYGRSIGIYALTNDAGATFSCSWTGSTLGVGVWGDE